MVGAGGGVVAVGAGARRSSKLTAAAAQASPDGTQRSLIFLRNYIGLIKQLPRHLLAAQAHASK
jgi:hypothetical protein